MKDILAKLFGFSLLASTVYWMCGSAAVFFISERLFPRVDLVTPWSPKHLNKNKILYLISSTIITNYFGFAFAFASAFEVDRLIGFSGLDISGWNIVWQVLILVVVLDFFSYLEHRFLNHGVMWKFHKVHHCNPEMDWLTTFQSHPVELLLQTMTRLSVLAFLTVSPAAFIQAGLISSLSILTHSNVFLPIGKLDLLFVTPQSHRSHHRKEFKFHHANFGIILSIWDVLFRTVQAPRRGTPADDYGITETYPQDFFPQMARSFSLERK